MVEWPKINFIVYDDIREKRLNMTDTRLVSSIGSGDTKIKIVVWRPINSLRRDEIIKKIQRIATEGISHLIIIDQDFSSALMTNWAIIGTNSKNYIPIKRISIVSNNFCCVDAYSVYGKIVNSQKSILVDNKNGIHIGHVAYLLKKLDSHLFGSIIKQSPYSETMFIPNSVTWCGQRDKTHTIQLRGTSNNKTISLQIFGPRHIDFINLLFIFQLRHKLIVQYNWIVYMIPQLIS